MSQMGIGSLVRSGADWKVAKRVDGKIVPGEWTVVSKGDIGRVVDITRRVGKGPIYRVKFNGGFVSVQGNHIKHVDGSAEEPLSRAVMKVADPDLYLRKDEGVEDAEY